LADFILRGFQMLIRDFARVGVLLAVFVMTGCATSRSEIRLTAAPPLDKAAAGSEVVIRSIEDVRVFEEAPAHPGTPSLGWGGAGAAPADIKARAIGRKRNTYGKALGDVLLEPGDSVIDVVRQNLAAALSSSGYRVVEAAEASPSALQLDVRIDKFWAWFQPGFWQITLNGDIATQLSFEGHSQPYDVSIAAQDKRQAAHDRAWVEILDMALAQYRAAVQSQAGGFPKTVSD
jgi:uncharacterized lipoprotein YajG